MIDIVRLYRDYGIHTAHSGQRGYRSGWLNCPCPFCTGNPGYHLGFNLSKQYFVCWRCGGHGKIKAFSSLLNLSFSQTYKVLEQYSSGFIRKENAVKIKANPYKRPSGLIPLTKRHKKYLKRRGFDADKLEQEFGLMGCGIYSQLDKITFNHRIFIPIYWDGEEVAFQCRDISGKTDVRYKACPDDRSRVNLKETLYGSGVWTDFGIAVEGVTDVWRIGDDAFGLFGIKYKPKQVQEIAKRFKRVVVWFDPDPQAQEQAKKLIMQLRLMGLQAFNYVRFEDPGDTPQGEVDRLVDAWRTDFARYCK